MRTLVMGILNVTPDSFSDGGQFETTDAAIRRAWRMLEEGADVIDIGAESTRPGAPRVSEAEEWQRLQPILNELCKQRDVRVSVDTYKSSVAARALDKGAWMINDVWGGRPPGDEGTDMLRVVAAAGCNYVWMHNRTSPVTTAPVETLLKETAAGVARCLAADIHAEQLWIDPGVGFGKTYAHNLAVLKRLAEFAALGPRVLLGTSRKSVIGHTLGQAPDDRLEGSLATVALGVWHGVAAVRVHDVLASVRTCRMVEAIRDVQI